MTFNQAKKLKKGDKVIQKMHGYILTVIEINEHASMIDNRKFITIDCTTESNTLMIVNHKDVILP